jgi:hypothetical protein
MKNIVLVLLVAVALIGSAAAWDTLDTLTVDHTKTGYVQAGNPGDYFYTADDVVESGGYYISGTPYGDSKAGVFNQLLYTDTTGVTHNTGTHPVGPNVDQTWTLSQEATAYSGARAINTADKKPEIAAGYTTSQEIHFNGLFDGAYNEPTAAQAIFASEGNAGVGDIGVSGFADLEHGRTFSQPGMIETDVPDTTVTDAWIGMASSADMTRDVIGGQNGVDDVFAGSVTSWAAFEGARGAGIVEANAGSYEQHVRLDTDGIVTGGWQAPAYTADTTGGFPNW